MNPEKGGFAPETPIKEFAWLSGGREKCLTWLEQEKKKSRTKRVKKLYDFSWDFGLEYRPGMD